MGYLAFPNGGGHNTLLGQVAGLRNPDLPEDALQSIQFQTVIEVLASGEIEGFPSATGSKGSTEYNRSALKDVFLNGTQVLRQGANNANPLDEDFNFKNISFEPRFGTSDQTSIPGINGSESERSVGVDVKKGQAVSRDIVDPNIDAVRVTMSFPSLQKFEENGDINGAEVDFKILTITANNSRVTHLEPKVRGRSNGTYFSDYLIRIDQLNLNADDFPVTVRVRRSTRDSTDATLQNQSIWHSMTEIIYEKRNYPDVAHVGLRFDAQTFPNTPQRMYRVRGTKIKIPHNGTVRADGSIAYSGTFNGTFKSEKYWSSDPAWVLWDLLTSSKGFGDHLDETKLDVYSFYSASVYASELIVNGDGGFEPRFSCNCVLNSQRSAYDTINNLAATMRAMPFYSAGAINLSCDKPTDPSYIYTLANVTEEGFSYSGASKDSKTTVVHVSYFDNETLEKDYETVEDEALQQKYGVVVRNINGFGCNSRSQARRLGKWYLYTQNNEAETVTFTTTLESGVIVRPGSVIGIQDPVRADTRKGGLIKQGLSTTLIKVDDQYFTDLSEADAATLSVILPDGTLETKSIQNISGDEIEVSSPFTAIPNQNSVWVIENNNIKVQLFRVVSVIEENQTNYKITALSHNPGKYAYVEDGTPLPERKISTLMDLRPAPSNLTANEQIVVLNDRAVSKLFISWQVEPGVSEYLVQYRFKDENFVSAKVSRPDFTIFETLKGKYEIKVFSYNTLGKLSKEPNTIIFETVGKTAPPEAIKNLTYEPLNDKTVRISWDLPKEPDVRHGGLIHVRHSLNPNDNWGRTVNLIEALAGNTTSADIPLLPGIVILKTEDDGGRYSPNDTSVIIDVPETQTPLIVQTRREDTDNPPYQGVKDDVSYNPTSGLLSLAGSGNFDNSQNIDAESDIDKLGGVVTTGTYFFKDRLDMGGIFSVDFRRHLLGAGFVYFTQNIDSRGLIDDIQDFDGTSSVEVDADVFIRTTNDDPASASPTYSAYQKFTNSIYKGRGFEFKCVLNSDDPNQDMTVLQLGYVASLQVRSETNSAPLTSGASTYNVTFTKPFFVGTGAVLALNSQLPSIIITSTNMMSQDYYLITNITGTGFSITFYKKNGDVVSRNFNYYATGFGKGD